MPDWFTDQFRAEFDRQAAAIGRFNLAIFGKTGTGKSTLVNAIFGTDIQWTTEQPWAWIGLVGVTVWWTMGFNAIIYLAAITGIDSSLHEAAAIDGANRFQVATRITLPLITPTIMIMTLLAVGKIMFGDFGMIYALVGDNGTLYRTTDIIDTYVFRALRQVGDPSQAMAIGLFQSAIGFLMVFGSNALVRRIYPDGALY